MAFICYDYIKWLNMRNTKTEASHSYNVQGLNNKLYKLVIKDLNILVNYLH